MWFAKLQSQIKGQIHTEKEFLDYYSVDSSSYQVRPKMVVFPKNTTDIINIVKFATKNKLSITPRGGGTGLVGSALNSGIILDMKYFDKVKVSKNFVYVEGGVTKGQLDAVLNSYNKFLGPNPSVGPYCTLGGMIATNAAGSRSLKYGSMIDNLIEITFISSSGKQVNIPSKSPQSKLILNLAKKIDKNTFPSVSKNSCGYRLDSVSNYNNVHKIFAASEGTLGIIISAKLKIFPIPKRALVVIEYKSIHTAIDDCENLLNLAPSALEFVDRHTMLNFNVKFSKNTSCLLLVEFDSNIPFSIKVLRKTCNGKITRILKDKNSIDRWWQYRNSALYYTLKSLGTKHVLPNIIEDATVPLNKLHELIITVQNLTKMPGCKLIMYGHIGNGNIHIRLALPLKSKSKIKKIAKNFFFNVIRLGGTISGEHGDGIARTGFVKFQYGLDTYRIFCKLKKQLDPKFTFNPGKIVA